MISLAAPSSMSCDSASYVSSSFGYRSVVDTVPQQAWDETLAQFKDTHFEQSACYASRHWKGRDSHLMLYRGDEAVAGARVAAVKVPLLNCGLAFLRFGPFWRRKDRPDDPAVYREMIRALIAEYCVKRGLCLSILPRPDPHYHQQECAWLAEMGVLPRRPQKDPERFFVDLSLNQDQQKASLDKKWRYALKQSNTHPFEIEMSDRMQDAAAFEQLYADMKQRKNFTSTSPVHMTHELLAELPDELKPKLFMMRHSNQLIAGAVVGLFGETAYNMFGATSDEALPLNAGYALQWHIISWLSGRNLRWYDLGGASHEAGLRHFKKGLMGRDGMLVELQGQHDYWTNNFGRQVTDLIFKVRDLERRLRHGKQYGQRG